MPSKQRDLTPGAETVVRPTYIPHLDQKNIPEPRPVYVPHLDPNAPHNQPENQRNRTNPVENENNPS